MLICYEFDKNLHDFPRLSALKSSSLRRVFKTPLSLSLSQLRFDDIKKTTGKPISIYLVSGQMLSNKKSTTYLVHIMNDNSCRHLSFWNLADIIY